MFKCCLLILSIILTTISLVYAESNLDSVSFATYYPAPYGNYKEMRAMRMAIGDNYIKTNDYDWETGATNLINYNADLIVEGNVGIGTMDPKSTLDVHGAIVMNGGDYGNWGGTTNSRSWLGICNNSTCNASTPVESSTGNYFFHISGSSNCNYGTHPNGNCKRVIGLFDTVIIPGGNVGIGTNNPQEKLDVSGNIYGWNVPREVKTTTTTHNGGFGGYQAMYNWIQLPAQGCEGYHVCDGTELSRYYQLHPDSFAGGWFNATLNWTGECSAWTATSGSWNGAVWNPIDGNRGNCGELHPVMCCR